MNIQSISKKDREVTVTLSADELVKICNLLYSTADNEKNDLYYKLYSEMMIARDMCQYGHIDNFCLANIVKCRNSFGNSDWYEVYSKIVGDSQSEKIKEWKENKG